MKTTITFTARSRSTSFVILGITLVIGFILLRGVQWHGSTALHTTMETAATLLALIVGVLALIHYYSHKTYTFLFIGTGFIGTSFLDGYHAVVTSSLFAEYFPSTPSSLIPWSWIASRIFLSILLFLSWLFWYKKIHLHHWHAVSEKWIYSTSAALTLASFLFFAFVPLPRAYFPELYFHRPEEFIPALFFGAALLGYLHKGEWKTSSFEYCLILSLIVGFLSQAMFMSLSGVIFDTMFDAAHLLKKVSYIFVLVGLLVSITMLFRKLDDSKKKIVSSEAHLRSIFDNVIDGILIIGTNGIVRSINPAGELIFGYPSAEIIGQNVKQLMPAEYRDTHDFNIQEYLASGRNDIFGQNREFQGRRKDGSIFPMELAVSLISTDEDSFFIGLTRDITERKKIDSMKNEFISVVSHELRTPLTAIRGSLGLIEGTMLDKIPEQAHSMLKIANNNTGRLLLLINDILDSEKIDSGKMVINYESIDIRGFINTVIKDNYPYAKQLEINIVISELNDGSFRADRDRLMQVMANLLSNAAKFSSPGSSIEISAFRLNNNIRFSVEDHGRGIDEEFLPKLFNKFTQSDSSDTRQIGGTGLGLNITKSIIELHGSRISVLSTLGEGSTFYFDLPEEDVSSDSFQKPANASM